VGVWVWKKRGVCFVVGGGGSWWGGRVAMGGGEPLHIFWSQNCNNAPFPYKIAVLVACVT